MSGDTKERILETALELFAQSGYLGTSMSDIAKQLGITKGALYKHYKSKQEILDCIVERMNQDRKIVLLKIIEQAAETALNMALDLLRHDRAQVRLDKQDLT